MIHMYKAAIFDLDGTLVDSLEDIGNSMNSVLKSNNFPIHNLESFRLFIGNGIRNLVRLSIPEEHRDEETITQCFNAMMDQYGDHCTDKTRPYDGVTKLLVELNRRKIKLSVLSNKSHELTLKVVNELFPTIKFEEIIGSSPDIPRKPNPHGAQLIIDRLQVRNNECIYIGDTGVDMQTASQLSIYSVGVLWGFRSSQELINNGANILIEHPLELLKFL